MVMAVVRALAVELDPDAAEVWKMMEPPAPDPVLAPPAMVKAAPAILEPLPPVAFRVKACGEALVSPLPMKTCEMNAAEPLLPTTMRLLAETVVESPAFVPMNIFPAPVVIADPAPLPMAILSFPPDEAPSAASADAPMATTRSPVELAVAALWPTATLSAGPPFAVNA